MPDYERMYALLCGAVDKAIDSLEKMPEAEHISQALQAALLKAEEIYIETAPYLDESEDSKMLEFRINTEKKNRCSAE